MAAEKVVVDQIRWSHAAYTDTAKCTMPLFVPSNPSFNARLSMSTHVSRLPEKYSFTLLLGSERVAALDVNPGAAHTNFVNGKRETVWETHWHTWPNIEHAEPDKRNFSHRKWLDAFARRYNLKILGGYKEPPHQGGMQLRLL